MVRTAGSVVRVGGKSAKKGGSSGGGGGGSSSSLSTTAATTARNHGGLNSIQNWDTPGWQKPITNFFQKTDKLPPIELDDKDDTQLPSRYLHVEMGSSSKVETEQEDKENTSPSTSKADEKKGENSKVANKRDVSVDEEIVENTVVVPYKKQKLDFSVFQGLEEWEAS